MGTLILVLLGILLVLTILSVALTVVERCRRSAEHDPRLRADRDLPPAPSDRPGRRRPWGGRS
ncbi:hypothetical protein [Actinomycetospora aeridis]|uniref:Histidine kinase n=1 Tax=Actinomycetospora aeridis TaxID=3129231 RepID=A0ABU8N335_9PSEU